MSETLKTYESLDQILDDVKLKLNPDGAGYHTSDAADEVFDRARKGCGFINAPMRDLARRGAAAAVKDHNSGRPAPASKLSRARKALESGQDDFAAISVGFGWMDLETALDEGGHALRKKYRHLDYDEVLQVITLKRKKGTEVFATADALQRVIDSHPSWRDHPERRMGEILGID